MGIDDKVKQINNNNDKLKNKMIQIINNHKDLENKIKSLQTKMEQHDNFYNNNNNELIKFKCILQDYQKELNASNYDYNMLNQYKIPNNNDNIQWTKQDMLHLKGKIKNSIKKSDQMLKQIVNGLQSAKENKNIDIFFD